MRKRSRREQAVALIIVLAFVVLLTGLVLAYFSRATSDRPVAHSSFHQSRVDQLAQSAMDNITGDLRQEIANGSISPTPTSPTGAPYIPTSAANMVPQRSGNPGTVPNLIRRSVRSDPILAPGRSSRASAVNSSTDPSANGRSIRSTRWNSHYLAPKKDIGTDDSEPIDDFTNATPDWVFVTKAGATPSPAAADVIGRYAYAIYDEGGLLSLNAAGYPSPTTILQYGRKGSLAFADLTGLGSFGLSAAAINNIVGWRNYASSQPSGNLSSGNLSFTSTTATTYYNFILSDPNYIKVQSYSPIFFLTTAWQAPQFNNQTDQAFTTRQQLIALRKTIGFSSNALQYLGTLSRQAMASVPQWSPTTPDSTNPNFQTLLVTASFTRNDGTTANVGDYLVDKRFLLQRLSWLTYLGPSASRTIPTSAPAIGNANYDMWLLTRNLATSFSANGIIFGLTSAFLQQGTDANILKYFGLAWDTANQRWNYVGHGGSATPIDSIATLGTWTAPREPDFFELLQAGIINNSLGDSFSSDPAFPSAHQQSKMLHILTIGANLIAQSRVDSYPVRIACSIGGTIMEAVGTPRLPCLSSLAACPIGVTGTNGGIYWFLVPNLWDPFRDTWDLTEVNTANSGNGPLLTPGYLRPPVRITVRGGVGFGSATVAQSGSVDPTTVTGPFPTLLSGINASLTLVTGNASFGRDGFREAMRLGSSDISGTVTSLNTSSAPTSASAQWNNIARPSGDTSASPPAPRTDNFIVFTLSLPGSGITSTSQNPILILQPGFQVSMDYQSPNGQWYSYSFLQGNNETSTWISSNLDLGTSFSQYARNVGAAFPTLLSSGSTALWTLSNLAQGPMFAKADPRSIRYNSQIGVVNLANPPMSFTSAGIIGSIWPSPYSAPPSMSPGPFPTPTPTSNANPATLGDNAAAGNGANPYSEAFGAADSSNSYRPVMMNRPFRSVGEMGYAFRDQPFRTLSFSSTNSPDAGLLDLFTTTAAGPTPTPSPSPTNTPITPTPTSTPRGGVISLNSLQAPALAAALKSTIRREDTPRQMNAGNPSPSPSPLGATDATNVATTLASLTSTGPVKNRADLATLIANVNPVGFDASVPKTQRESIARALGEIGQARTWNLMLDVIAQTGRYAPGETNLTKFIVEGEQRYWIHVAIDRFTGQVIDKQIEVVNE